MLLGVGSLGVGSGDVGAMVGVAEVRDGLGELGGTVGVLLGVGLAVVGAGVGALWLQATGPIIHAATNTATRAGRRMLLLDVGPQSGA